MSEKEEIQSIVLSKLADLALLCHTYNVDTLYVFGSATSQKFSEKSDIDFLVTFGDIPLLDYADYFFDFMHALENLYNRKIDLITEKSLSNPYLIKSINQSKRLLYDRRNKKISA